MRHRLVPVVFVLWALLLPHSRAAGQPAPAQAVDPQWVRLLETLGAAYAKDVKLPLAKVEIHGAHRLGAEAPPSWGSTWAQQLEQTLSIGYAPEPGQFERILLSQLKPIMKIEMRGNRTPEEVLRSVLKPGNTIVAVVWHLGPNVIGDVVTPNSVAIFSPRGELLFDSMLSLPIIRGPVFSVGHPSPRTSAGCC